jgi:SAM-dependent methyltransferase
MKSRTFIESDPSLRPKRKIVFCHIAKTGGKSVDAFFTSMLGKDRCATFAEDQVLRGMSVASISQTKDYISGHIYFDDLRALPRDEFLVFTLLREPFAHLCSHLLWLDHLGSPERKDTYDLLPDIVQEVIDSVIRCDLSNPQSLGDLLANLTPAGTALLDNLQTRYLAAPAGSMARMTRADAEQALLNMDRLDVIGDTACISKAVTTILELSGLPATWLAKTGIPHVNAARSSRLMNSTIAATRTVLATRLQADMIVADGHSARQRVQRPAGGKLSMSEVFSYYDFLVPKRLAELTGAGNETFAEISNQHLHVLRKYVGINPGETFLEVGCGIGRDAIPLANHFCDGARYLGIDIIGESINWCSQNITTRYPTFRFHHFDIQDEVHNPQGRLGMDDVVLPISENSADLVFMFSVATHLLGSELGAYLRLLSAALKPSGRILMSAFLLDPIRKAQLSEAPLTEYQLRFAHLIAPGIYVQDAERPHAAVAYDTDVLLALCNDAGLFKSREPIWGDWCLGDFPSEESGQDLLVLKRI